VGKMIGILLFFFGERIVLSKDIKFTNENKKDNDHINDINEKDKLTNTIPI
jgi:hypothetical protein